VGWRARSINKCPVPRRSPNLHPLPFKFSSCVCQPSDPLTSRDQILSCYTYPLCSVRSLDIFCVRERGTRAHWHGMARERHCLNTLPQTRLRFATGLAPADLHSAALLPTSTGDVHATSNLSACLFCYDVFRAHHYATGARCRTVHLCLTHDATLLPGVPRVTPSNIVLASILRWFDLHMGDVRWDSGRPRRSTPLAVCTRFAGQRPQHRTPSPLLRYYVPNGVPLRTAHHSAGAVRNLWRGQARRFRLPYAAVARAHAHARSCA